MKKKILALVCAMTMVCAMGLSVAAEESVTSDAVAGAVESVAGSAASSITVSDDVVTISVDGASTTLPVSAANREASAETANALILTDGVEAAPVTSTDVTAIATIAKEVVTLAKGEEDVEVKFLADLSGTTTTFTVDMPLGANDTAYAVHVKADGSVEVVKGASDGKGIAFTLSSYSPVAIVVVTADVAADTNDAPATDAPAVEATSPKTGSVAAAMALLALVSGCGAAVLGKKEN